jgi:hypothetical protein
MTLININENRKEVMFMAKSQSGSLLREALLLLSLRGAFPWKGDVAISKNSPRGRKNAWPGQEDLLPYVLALEGRGLR